MSNKANVLLLILVLGSTQCVIGQYFQYTQYNFTQQRVNPAMIGLTRYASVSLDYRNQKTGGDFNINSTFFSAIYPLLNSSTGVPWSAVGITLHNDHSSGIFRTNELAVSYALHIKIKRFQSLSLGAKGLYQTRSISYDGFFTGSQYVPDRGFDLSYSNGEMFTELKNSFKTFSIGTYWQETDKKGRVLHHAGFSLFDFNKPRDSFFDNASYLASTFVFHGGFQVYSTLDTHIFPEALVTVSASTASFNVGMRIQKEFNSKPKKQSDRFEVLAKYAVGRSGILGMQLHRENFSFGLSYDFPVVRANVGNLGAFEVGLELRKLVATRAQKLIAKRKKTTSVSQQARLKNQRPTDNQKRELKPITQNGTPPDSVSKLSSEEPLTVPQIAIASEIEAAGKAGTLKHEPLVVEKITLHFAFEFNSSELDDETENFLQELATTLKENEYLHVKITGHTDNIGSDKFNLKLSQKRAEVVKQHLIKMGIASDRINSEGKGMHEPLNANLTEEDRAKNRRVEISLVY